MIIQIRSPEWQMQNEIKAKYLIEADLQKRRILDNMEPDLMIL